MASITLTEQEYNDLKEKADKVPLLEKAANKDGYVIVTRYDRDISVDSPIIDSYVDFILESFNRQYGEPNHKYASFGYNSYDETRAKYEILKNSIKAFIIKYINTKDKKPFSKVSSELINFKDVEEEIRELYNHKYFEEFGERINKFKEDESCLAHKIKTFEKTNEQKIKNLENKIQDLQHFEWEHYNDEKKIKDLEFNLSEANAKIELYRETITTQKEEIERLNNSKR